MSGDHERPEWWTWEIEISPHVEERMQDREFSEVDLRAMFDDATGYRPDVEQGRWIVETRHGRRSWKVIVEPDANEQLLVVVTAYPVE